MKPLLYNVFLHAVCLYYLGLQGIGGKAVCSS